MNYSIGQFAVISQLSIETLRFYEKEGLIIVNRDSSGRRQYTDEDVQWILFIRRLKETGMSLKEIRRYAELRYQGDSTLEERLQMLEQHQVYVLSEIARWEANLKNLNEKINIYKNKLKNPFIHDLLP